MLTLILLPGSVSYGLWGAYLHPLSGGINVIHYVAVTVTFSGGYCLILQLLPPPAVASDVGGGRGPSTFAHPISLSPAVCSSTRRGGTIDLRCIALPL